MRYAGGAWSRAFPALDSDRTLVLAFASPSYRDRADLFGELAAAFPTSALLGCSTSGEIDQASVVDDSITVAIVRFAQTNLRLAHAHLDSAAGSEAAGGALADALRGDDLRAVFVLSEGVQVNGSELVRGLNAGLPA